MTVELDELMKKFEEIVGDKGRGKTTEKVPEVTSDELKALLDKDELTQPEIATLLRHIARHKQDDVTLCATVMVETENAYKVAGGISGKPGHAALCVLKMLKSVLEDCG